MSSRPTFNRLSSKWILPFVVVSIIYWLWFGLVVGVSAMEIGTYTIALVFFFSILKTRQLILAFLPLYIYLFFYGSLKILHLYNGFPIHNEDIYLLEKSIFGFEYLGKEIIPCEYFAVNTNRFFDFISGLFYITWMPFPLIFGFLTFFTKKQKITFDFWLCFLITNLLGFIGYVVYPAAPPWYYFEYGAEIIHNAPPNAAGLLRFDQMLGINLYEGMYSQNAYTFGAMPSMHSAFPVVLLYYSLKYGKKLISLVVGISLISIWFGAVYSNHHYIIDVIVGIFCAILGILITEMLVNRKFTPNWYQKVLSYINQ